MNKSILWLFAFFVGLTMFGCSSTPMKAVSVPLDGKTFVITDVENIREANVVHSADIPGGVYIVATDFMFGNYLPESQKIIRDVFIANHIKVTDKIDEASIGIEFFTTGYVNPSASSQAGTSLAVLALSIASARQGQASGATAGHASKGTTLNAVVSPKPKLVLRGDICSSVRPTDEWGAKTSAVHVKFHDESGEVASYESGLKITTQKWIDHFMVNDVVDATSIKKL